MRGEYTLALRRETEEFEQALIEQRVEKIFEEFYDILGPAGAYLRSVLTKNDAKVLDQLEQVYFQALEKACRSALGVHVTQRRDSIAEQRAAIPMAPLEPTLPITTQGDEVLKVRPCS